YREPVSMTIELVGGILCLLFLLVFGALTVRIVASRDLRRQVDRSGLRAVLGFLVAFAVFGPAGITVPFIRVAEIDVTPSGFRQARYDTSTSLAFFFFNTTRIPVRVCLGSQGHCDGTDGPAALRAPGLTLPPSGTAHVSFPVEGQYRITVVGLPSGATR